MSVDTSPRAGSGGGAVGGGDGRELPATSVPHGVGGTRAASDATLAASPGSPAETVSSGDLEASGANAHIANAHIAPPAGPAPAAATTTAARAGAPAGPPPSYADIAGSLAPPSSSQRRVRAKRASTAVHGDGGDVLSSSSDSDDNVGVGEAQQLLRAGAGSRTPQSAPGTTCVGDCDACGCIRGCCAAATVCTHASA